VIVDNEKFPNSLAVIIRQEGRDQKYSVLIMCDKSKLVTKKSQVAPTVRKGNDWEVVKIPIEDIMRICKQKLKIDPAKLIEKPDKVAL